MAGAAPDNYQWLSVTEETLFLHDGLMRITDLVELPRDVNSAHEEENEVVSFDAKNPSELSERLMTVCGRQNNAYARLLEYRLSALRGYWNAHRHIALEELAERDAATQEETLKKKQGLWKEPEQAAFSTRISLLLVLPLLQSQSKQDSNLCGVTAELLLNCLRDCLPLSLNNEPGDCLTGLETLLCSWLGESPEQNVRGTSSQAVSDPKQRENAAAALVALACARGHLKMFIHTVHLLQKMTDIESLPVADIMSKLLEIEGGHGQQTGLLGSKHVVCWGFEDMLTDNDTPPSQAPSTDKDKGAKVEVEFGRSSSCDGVFLFTTNSSGKGLAKVGTGLHGTLRGFVYARNADIGPGWVAWGNGRLLYRPSSYDKEANSDHLVQILNPCTLQPTKTISKPEKISTSCPMTTVSLCSDGAYFYWLWCSATLSDKNAKGQNVYLETFRLDVPNGKAIPLRGQTLLQRKEETSQKTINEALMSRLRPQRGSATTGTLVSITGSEPVTTKKTEECVTSMGIPLRILLRTPLFCDGSSVVVISPLPGSSNSAATRSLFGSGGSLSSIRNLAMNMSFNVDDGQFNARTDLADAPSCAIARGNSVLGLGVCFDVVNNGIWSCSSDWVDQFHNPAHQAPHHIFRKLGIPIDRHKPTQPKDVRVGMGEIIKGLLQHVGSTCVHELNALHHTPLVSSHQHPVDLQYMERVCDILEKSILDGDERITICALIVLQLIFKESLFKKEKDKEIQLIKRSSSLMWKLLTMTPAHESRVCKVSNVQLETCQVMRAALSVIYPTTQASNSLIHKLLAEGNKNPALGKLRDLVLVDFAEQLKNPALSKEDMKSLRLTDDLVKFIMKLAIKESASVLRCSQKKNKQAFEELLASVPRSSSCLRYVMSLLSCLLREAVLCDKPVDINDAEQVDKSLYLQDLHQSVLRLSGQIFSGSYEVLEVLLETCTAVISNHSEELEYRLQGLERITKSTILGHLLPLLLTTMTHTNLQCLIMSDQLMPQLVQLVVLSSQAALLLKSQVQAIRQDEPDGYEDVVDLIGKSITPDSLSMEEWFVNDGLVIPAFTINHMSNLPTLADKLESVEKEEEGFLAGLKIPAPWASGKCVESIHPVRDNYKFKETVHIPGARCLYLRFDPRCSSQYDYDKLIVYAAPNTNAKKTAEYGGNTYGFGSRSVLGSGWPKDLVKVEGDTVTFSFEMRSGREHNTPDKAMWGFMITVRAQECSEEVSCGLPFLADLALGLSVLSCTMLHLLYQGPEKSPKEMACQHLLKSKLLQRCVWQTESGSCTLPLSPVKSNPTILDSKETKVQPKMTLLPRVRLPSDIIQKLREMSARSLPHLRPSIKAAIQPEVLEECIVSATIKHLSLSDMIHHLATIQQQQGDDFWLISNIMEEVYRRFDALIRQLQSLAELEQKWHREVEDKHEGVLSENVPFFFDYHLSESKLKVLMMLCYLKGLELDLSDPEAAVKELRDKFDEDVERAKSSGSKLSPLIRVKSLVQGLQQRLELLLHVTIAPKDDDTGSMTRSVSYFTDALRYVPNAMVRSDTDVLKSTYSRSLSAPSGLESAQDDSIIEIMKLQRKRQAQRKAPASILQDLVEEENTDKPPLVLLIDQLFSFIGSDPEKAVSCEDFLSVAKIRWKRGTTRKQALVHMKELLMAACRVGGATHLVAAVTSVLQHGPRVEELTCGGMVGQVREAFSETMTSVVQLAARFPIACCNSIGLLCIIPYTRAEEKCLVRCGLVHLLDKLCSLGNPLGDTMTSDLQTTRQKVSSMAWAGFQVLANRGVAWETEDSSISEELEHTGLARQVSVLLTNHLARATEGNGNEAAGNEALQEVLSLLNNLARSRMGKAILSQPACVSKLLSLLLDQRPSPKLVLVILQLCRVALPLMTSLDCEEVELPAWGQDIHTTCENNLADPPSRIVSLLLAKLGDFLVPGDQVTVSSSQMFSDSLNGHQGAAGGVAMDKEKMDEREIQEGRLSVFVHKREDQSSHEVIQPLLSSDNRPFRLGSGANMERVVRMDREMTKTGKAEVLTEDAIPAIMKAAKWAQMGLVVSTGLPADSATNESNSSDKKKTAVDVICKEKNAEFSRTDPIRPFISGQVANSMAAEVIALLHGLLTSRQSSTTHTWAQAVTKVLSEALSNLPVLVSSIEALGSPRCNPSQLMLMAKQADAALSALGGFSETIKPGCEAKITGDGIHNSSGQVLSLSGQTGLATVQLNPEPNDLQYAARYSDTVQVPLARLLPPRNENLALERLPMTDAVISTVNSLFLPQDGSTSPLQQPLPVNGDGNTLVNQTCRVIAEIRSRAGHVLATYLKDFDFAKELIQCCGNPVIDTLKSLAKDCATGERVSVLGSQCERLRMLYRDCIKPPPPPSKATSKTNQEITWDTSRAFPPVRSCLFSRSLTGITFFGDPSAGTGLPRGTLVYATQPIPTQAPSFYWELLVCSFGDSQEESSAVVSFGFAPPAEKRDGAWTNPVGTCLFLNNGKAVHYNGASLLQWRSVRLDANLSVWDVAGIGWERTDDSPPVLGQTPKGRVYFTYKGRRLSVTIEDVSGGMYPVVHIQKKNTRIRANFGAQPFAYAEGQHHRDAADEHTDVLREIRESFGVLPFCPGSDSEGESSTALSSTSNLSDREVKTTPRTPCRVAQSPQSLKEYNSESFRQYKLLQSYDCFVKSGPDLQTQQANQEEESEEEDAGNEEQQVEDHYALLVKAWEQKVFPVIRRRFRNEAERKDGLEQIRGALQLGMTDIARQTVEFLYEENGGMPRDLHLPTIEDIKEDLAKFTVERVRKGTTVIIRTASGGGTAGTTVLPKFAVRGMLRTFGLTGTVLDIDTQHELIQVEVYLRSEGVLVRYWYPLDMLEKPAQGFRKCSITGGQTLDTSNPLIHRELLRCESGLLRMYCRTALLQLIDHCNSPVMEVSSCAASLGSGMAASAAVLQELDIENLQLLSNEVLCPPQPHGGVVAQSLSTSKSPGQCLTPHCASLSQLIFTYPDRLKKELVVAIARAANQGEDYLIELTTQLCMCMQTAPEMFHFEEFPVTEVKVNTDVHFPGAACLVISCKNDQKTNKKENSLYKSPWARIFCYNGHRVKKSGQATKQEVICFPRDVTSSSNQNDQYAPVILPTDRIHVKLGVSPPPGVIVTVHALPPQFLLAIAYLETLVDENEGCGTRSCGNLAVSARNSAINLTEPPSLPPQASLWKLDKITITPPVFLHAFEMIGTYLWRTDIPAYIKEYVFHILAQTLRVLLYSDYTISPIMHTLSAHLNPSQGILAHLQTELKKLYDEETKNWTSSVTASGTGMGLGVSDQGRFSSYFHSLMEVCLAIAEVTSPPPGTVRPGAPLLSTTDLASTSTLQAPPVSPTGAKRKKLKTKKERGSGGRRSGSPKSSESETSVTPSSSQTATQASPGTSASSSSVTDTVTPQTSPTPIPSTKLEDILWFHRAMTVSQILRYLNFEEDQGESIMMDAVSDASQTLTNPMAHTRLLVITGIPRHFDQDFVKKAIRKVCASLGGLFKDEIFVPLYSQKSMIGETSATLKSTSSLPESSPPPNSQNDDTKPGVSKSVDSSVPLGAYSSSKQMIRGYAVIELSSKTKVDAVKKALYKCKALLEGEEESSVHVDVPEDVMSVSTVSQNFVADQQANEALEHYLLFRILHHERAEELTDGATIALTEIFHSCFISEQRADPSETRQESGYICLSREQIVGQTTGNLLAPFFNHIRQPKKSVNDQVTQALRKYGFSRPPDKDGLSPIDKNGKGRAPKKSTKPSKERVVLGCVEKTTSKEKRPKSKESLEKVHKDSTTDLTAKQSKSWSKEEEKYLTLDGFLQLVADISKQNVRCVWRALQACGFDLHFDRCACIDNGQAQQMAKQWSLEMDYALVNFVNSTCRQLAVCPARLHPHEIYITDSQLTDERYACLQGLPIESIRLRYALLQSLNNSLETFFLPLVDLRPAKVYSRSTAAILSQARGLLFYDTKINFMNRVLNGTAKRKPDQAAPEISHDPLESIGGEKRDCMKSGFCQAYRQLAGISSSQLCVRLAAGGDPTYAFNVRLTGEEVHGTSGSFRHFLWQVARELQSPMLNLLVNCTNTGQSGRWILRPGKMTYAEEQLLRFLGQLLGVTVRADIPIGLELLGVFWKALVGVPVDPVTDLKEADGLTYHYIKKLEMAECESELLALCSDVYNRFIYPSLTGDEVELICGGGEIPISWSNKQQYVDRIREMRRDELLSEDRMRAIQAGLATIIPLQLLAIMSPLDMEIRTCGLPSVDLHFLKSHTMYQVGLMETDRHIEYFWNSLDTLSQDDLCRFIKFACNQERIPQSCPCKDGGTDTAHVPPYPMKIAPPDGTAGNPDGRYIRAETCMFMIKLPQYSCQEVTTQRLMYAIHCREDPLSG